MKVAVGLIYDTKGKILIARRALHATHGGFWEFPGGKVEDSEQPEHALIREIKEEVGLEIQSFSFWDEVLHSYATKDVHLLFYKVDKFQGQAVCREEQMELLWVNIQELVDFQFPEANAKIIAGIM